MRNSPFVVRACHVIELLTRDSTELTKRRRPCLKLNLTGPRFVETPIAVIVTCFGVPQLIEFVRTTEHTHWG